jgi:hypothetical protein
LHFIGTELAEVASSRRDACASYVSADPEGVVRERALDVRYLGSAAAGSAPAAAGEGSTRAAAEPLAA